MLSNEELCRRFVEKIGKSRERLGTPIPDWEKHWKEIANATRGLELEDPGLESVRAHLTSCDQAFLRGDWSDFKKYSERLMNFLKD